MMEDLREMCIYKAAYRTPATRFQFWEYMKKIHQSCGSTLNADCSRNAMRKLPAINWEAI